MSASDAIVVVTGSPRCGTTLMMRMLFHGGVPVHAQSYVSFEHTDTSPGRPQTWAWLPSCTGRAVKLLEPLYQSSPPPPGHAYRFILMERDPIQQARSFLKFSRVLGDELKPGSEAILAQSFRDDYPKMRVLLERRGPLLRVCFEDVLADPTREAERVTAFLDRPLDVASMVRQVIKRDPECLPYMLEERMLGTGR